MFFFRNKNFWFYALITVIIAFGVFIRFWHLSTIPPGIQYDEAFNGIDALNALETGHFNIFYPDNTGREGLHINAEAFFIKFFGNTSLGLRLTNAMWGSLTIIGFFFLLGALRFSRLSQALGTFMLSFSFWHLVFSRTAFRAIMVPLLLVWMFYFFTKGINTSGRKRYLNFALSGIFLGLGFYTYIAFRIAPLIFIIMGLLAVLTLKDFFRNYWKIILLVLTLSLIIAMPMLIYYAGHWHDFIFHSLAVSILSAPKITPWQAFWLSLGSHLNAFFVHGDNNPRHNYNGQPLLPAAWSVLFAIGFIISLKEIIITLINFLKYKFPKNKQDRKKEPRVTRWFYVSILAQSIFWVMLIPGILSIEGIPHSLRIIGTIPAVFIMTVLPVEYIISLYDFFKKALPSSSESFWQGGKFITIVIGFMVMIIYGGISQVHVYFNLWAQDVRTESAYEQKLYFMGSLMKQLPLHNNNYVITAYNTFITSDRHQSSLKTVEFLAYPKIKNYLFFRPLDGINGLTCDDPQIVFQESDQWLRDQYRNKCPGLNTKRFDFDNKKYTFFVLSNDQ